MSLAVAIVALRSAKDDTESAILNGERYIPQGPCVSKTPPFLLLNVLSATSECVNRFLLKSARVFENSSVAFSQMLPRDLLHRVQKQPCDAEMPVILIRFDGGNTGLWQPIRKPREFAEIREPVQQHDVGDL